MVTERSAESATYVVALALLLPEFGSCVVEVTESVWVMTVPAATVLLTVTTNVKLAVPAVIAAVSVQVRVPSTQVHPDGPVRETAVVFAGSVSVNTGALADAGPALVTLCVYVMLLPAVTGLGLAELVALKSASLAEVTPMFEVAVLLFRLVSCDVVATETVSAMMVPAVALPLTVYFSVNVPDPGATLALVHCVGKLVQVHPVVAAMDANVVFMGVVSLNVAVLQLLGPALVTTCV